MATLTDAQRRNGMKRAIEDAIQQAASAPGAPEVAIDEWHFNAGEPELPVVVGGIRRILEVSEPFLEDEPDDEALRSISTAARALIKGSAKRVMLYHQGVFGGWER